MPEELPQNEIDFAYAAAEYAQQVRSYHRRRTERGTKSREADIEVALARLRSAMRPLRTHIGKFQYGPQTQTAQANRQIIRDASAVLQKERRKLWKLSNRKKNK